MYRYNIWIEYVKFDLYRYRQLLLLFFGPIYVDLYLELYVAYLCEIPIWGNRDLENSNRRNLYAELIRESNIIYISRRELCCNGTRFRDQSTTYSGHANMWQPHGVVKNIKWIPSGPISGPIYYYIFSKKIQPVP